MRKKVEQPKQHKTTWVLFRTCTLKDFLRIYPVPWICTIDTQLFKEKFKK